MTASNSSRTVLKPGDDDRRATPLPHEVLLIIEVARSSLAYALCARHGIPEFWIVNLAAREVEVCRTPQGDGYASFMRLGRDAVLEPELLPGAAIPVAALLG